MSLVLLNFVTFSVRGGFRDFDVVESGPNKSATVVFCQTTVTFLTYNGHYQLILTVTLHLIDTYLRYFFSLPGQSMKEANDQRDEYVQHRNVYLEAMVELKACVLPDRSVTDAQGGVWDSLPFCRGLKITTGDRALDFAVHFLF